MTGATGSEYVLILLPPQMRATGGRAQQRLGEAHDDSTVCPRIRLLPACAARPDAIEQLIALLDDIEGDPGADATPPTITAARLASPER
jgi:hypothetical protein